MHPEDIKALLRKKGTSASDVARFLGVQPPIVSSVIHGRYTSWRVARRISVLVGVPVSKLWPDRYPQLEINETRVAA